MEKCRLISQTLFALVLAGLIAQPVLAQVHNETFFGYNQEYWYVTEGDQAPNDPSIWEGFVVGGFFQNSDDDSDQPLLGPYLNLTTTTNFSSFDPNYDENGTTSGGFPYYIWNSTEVEIQEMEEWYIYGYTDSLPLVEPGFSLKRSYTPRVIRLPKSIQILVVEVNLEDNQTSHLYIGIRCWPTKEADATIIGAFLQAPAGALAENVKTADWGSHELGIDDPPVGTYKLVALLKITNKLFPKPIRYIPWVQVHAHRWDPVEEELANRVTFTAQDDSIVTFGGKETYHWSYREQLVRIVELQQVSETI